MHLPLLMKIFLTGGVITIVACAFGAMSVDNDKHQFGAKVGACVGVIVAITSLLVGVWSY